MSTDTFCRCATVLLALWPLQASAADCEYETWNLLQANKNNATALDTIIAPSWVREPEFRGTFSILQTCILTLMACVYTGLHLNVPNETQSGWARILAYKARWMFMALVCPEVILVLALDQLKAARKLHQELLSLHSVSGRGKNEKERAYIDLMYGFFVVMGGIRVKVSDLRKPCYLSKSSIDENWDDYIKAIISDSECFESGRTFQLTPAGVIALAEAGRWDVLLSSDTIEDKSKANAIQKSLVLLQVSWMVVACIARLVYRLPLTLLEIHTMVHVSCAFAMYGLWFKKPLDIQDAKLITLEEANPVVAGMVQMSFYSEQLRRLSLGGKEHDNKVLSVSNDELVTPGPSPHVANSGALVVLIDSKSEAGNPTVDDEDEAARFKLLTQFLIFKALSEKQPSATAHDGGIDTPKGPASSHVLAFGDMATQLRHLQQGASKTSFCRTSNASVSRDHGDGRSNSSFFLVGHAMMGLGGVEPSVLSAMVTVFLTMAYGGVHLAAWNSPCFPTDTERLLWRVSCFFIAGVVPFVFVILLSIFARGGVVYVLASSILTAVALLFYALSRVFVVVESFISLRQVPVGAYWVPPWLQSIPHV